MKSVAQVLPFPLEPTPDERLTHYLARVTDHHLYNSVTWLLDAAGVRGHQQTKATGLRQALHEPYAAGPLAMLCGTETSSIERMQHRRIGTSAEVMRVNLGELTVQPDLMVPLRRRYCPACETESLEDSKLLDFAYYLACPRHRCRIVDACSCGASLSWDTGLTPFCTICEEAFAAQSRPATEELLELSTHLTEIYSGQAAPDDAPYRDFETLAEVLGAFARIIIPESSLGRYEYGAEKLDYETLALHATTAWRWVRNRTSFKREFISWVSRRQEAWPDLPTRGWYVDLQRVVSGVSDYESRQLLSLWIKSALSANRESYRPLLSAGPLPKKNEVTLRWAAWILGTSDHNIRRFVKAGRLNTTQAFADRKRSDLIISLAQLNAFCSSLRLIASKDLGENRTPFLRATRSFKMNGAGLGVEAALKAVLQGSRAAAWKPGSGLEGLELGLEKTEFPTLDGVELSSAFSIVDAARDIGIYPDALYRLIKAGILKTRERNKRNQSSHCLTVEQLDEFKKTYVFAGELARLWGVGRTSLTDRLIDQGINPVSGPNVDGGLVYLFRRDSIESVKPESVQKYVAYKSRAGRHLKDVERLDRLTSTQVCERLNLSAQMLGKVVDAGYLLATSESYSIGNRRFFDPTAVEDYARRYFENADLVEVTEAAKHAGCTRKTFLRTYVMSGLITTISDGAKRLFVDRLALAEALRADAEWLPRFRAAEVLGIDTVKLANLRSTGRIKCQVRDVLGKAIHYYPVRDCAAALL